MAVISILLESGPLILIDDESDYHKLVQRIKIVNEEDINNP